MFISSALDEEGIKWAYKILVAYLKWKNKQFVAYSQSDVPLLMFIDTYRIYM